MQSKIVIHGITKNIYLSRWHCNQLSIASFCLETDPNIGSIDQQICTPVTMVLLGKVMSCDGTMMKMCMLAH